MLKYVLLASAMTVSMPALAQSKPADPATAPTTQLAPAQTVPQAAPIPATPADTARPQSVTPADPMANAPANPAVAQDSQAAAQPANGADQIAKVVSTEFPSYDKDKSGSLNESEFGTWMVALKEKGDPTTKPDSPATKAWVGQAFASADKDKNKALSKAELTSFLSQGA